LISIVLTASLSCSGAQKAKSSETTDEETVEQTVDAPEEEPDETAETEEMPPDQGEGIPWNSKTDDQQKAYMKLTVKPKMETLFTEFDAEKFSEVKCTTCHGDRAEEGNFEMPSPDLPKLEDWEKLEAEQPEMMTFMKEKVVPEMAAMLDQEPFDPETKTGFGCGGCHPH
jgi:hypothetical protein